MTADPNLSLDLVNATKGQALNTGALAQAFSSLSSAIVSAFQSILGTLASLAPLASPTFTGTPAAPTANAGTNTTQIATTAFVTSAIPLIPPFQPQGRLTLTTGTPVLTSSVSGATTVYYAPYTGIFCPLWDGTQFYPANIGGELSQSTTDATKSPAAVGASSVYDLFVWNDSGTFRCTRGPAWSSATNRGTGAGTTELNRVNGLLVNKYAITNGPAAGYGTFVGSIASNASSTIDYIFGSSASGGGAAYLKVWNAFNRVKVTTMVHDNTDSWTYATVALRSANNSTNNRVTFLSGQQEDSFNAVYSINALRGSGGNDYAMIGFDSTSASSGSKGSGDVVGTANWHAMYSSSCVGLHYLQALENGNGGTSTFYGNGFGRMGLFFDFMM